jgi:hypothetical protein
MKGACRHPLSGKQAAWIISFQIISKTLMLSELLGFMNESKTLLSPRIFIWLPPLGMSHSAERVDISIIFVQICGLLKFSSRRDMKISGFIFGGLAIIMNFDFVPRNVIIRETKNVSEPPVAHLVPAAFDIEIKIRKVVGTFLIGQLDPKSGIKLSNDLIIPIILEGHNILHFLSLTGPQSLCHLWISNSFTAFPVDVPLMQNGLMFLGKNYRVVEIDMMKSPEPIPINPGITNT